MSAKKAGGSWRDRGKFIGESRASAIGKCASVYLGTTRKLPEGGAILHTRTQACIWGGRGSFYSNMQTFDGSFSSLVLQKRASLFLFWLRLNSYIYMYIREMIWYLKLSSLKGKLYEKLSEYLINLLDRIGDLSFVR